MAGKKFHFSLDSVLKLKRHEADMARQFLARAIEQRIAHEQRLREVDERLEEVNETAAVSSPSDPVSFQRLSTYRLELQRARDREIRSVASKRQEEDRARRLLIEKRREEETMQSLHDEEASRHKQSQNAAETAFLDEQALMTYQRKHRRIQR